MRFLLVDDEQSNLDELALILEEVCPHSTSQLCNSPTLAIEAVEVDSFDIAFLDIQMPGMTGLELAELINTQSPATVIIFITAYNHYAAEAFDINAIDYVLKPLRRERVAKAIEKYAQLDRRKSQKKPELELSVFAFGDNRLLCGQQEIRWNRGKTGELFWILLMNRGNRIHKEELCSMLWPEFSLRQALANLQVTLHRVRKELECFERHHICIDYSSDRYCLQLGSGFYDVDEFNRLLEHNESPADLHRAVSLYTGAFLGKTGWQWAEHEGERLRQKYLHALNELAGYYITSENYVAAEQLLTHHLREDTLSDHLAALLLQASWARGHRGLKYTYQKLKKMYWQQLDIGLPDHVETLYKKFAK